MSVESATACKDIELGNRQSQEDAVAGVRVPVVVAGGVGSGGVADEDNLQDEKLSSHVQMSALGNQQKEQILHQLDQLKRDLNEKFMLPANTHKDDDNPNKQTSRLEMQVDDHDALLGKNMFKKNIRCVMKGFSFLPALPRQI